jgi:hypothetical protein
VACAATLFIGSNAYAAYKCVVDGTTAYQERPFDDELKKRAAKPSLRHHPSALI